MTGGRIKRAQEFVGDINIKELVEYHDGCITMTSSQPAGRFGALNLDVDNKIFRKVMGLGLYSR